MSTEEAVTVDEDTPDDLRTRLEALASRVDALSNQNRTLKQDLLETTTELEAVRTELEAEREARKQLERDLSEAIAELDSRTDLLSLVESGNDLGKRQRCAILVQHLKRKAIAKQDRGEPAKASLDDDGWEDTLHQPDLERTNAYKDMQRAAELVGDSDVLWYENGQLRMNLEASDGRPGSIQVSQHDSG